LLVVETALDRQKGQTAGAVVADETGATGALIGISYGFTPLRNGATDCRGTRYRKL
jgi:hypothetical protein